MDIENYDFPGWDRCMRCLCHMQDECPDLEHLYSVQQDEMWWNCLSEEEKLRMRTEEAARAVGTMLNNLLEREWSPF